VARVRAAAVAAILALAGCAVGPDFHHPLSDLPLSWLTGPDALRTARRSLPVPEPIDPAWWSLLQDRELTALEARVAAANLDVLSATIRLAESREQRGIAGASLFPTLGASASYDVSKVSPKGVYGLLDGLLNGKPSGNSAFPPIDLYQDAVDASWQLDIWGKVRREVESADASVEASADDRRNVLLMSLAEVARDYIQLRNTQAQLAIARDNLRSSQQSLDLTRRRNAEGISTMLDVNNAAAQVESTAAQVPQLEDQQEQQVNALSLLLGEPPGALRAELVQPLPVPPVPPRVPVGLPSELARRRPDIREAEARLHAAVAEIGAAQADFYPSLTLTGTFGFQALNIQNFSNWAARTWMVGPALQLPIFQGGRLTATLRLRRAQAQEAAVAYHATVLRAWHEIANALSAYAAEQRRRERLAHEVEFTRAALALARQQYAVGVADFLNVLDAERTMLTAEQSLATSTATVSTDLVTLYRALGGGWETAYPDTRDNLSRQERRSPYGTIVLPEGR
jgi:NodT family efflux transporter outer membrane factor (OMF) lipoprotein